MDKQAIISLCVELKADGLSYQGIVNELNKRGIPTLKSGGRWNKGTVQKWVLQSDTFPVANSVELIKQPDTQVFESPVESVKQESVKSIKQTDIVDSLRNEIDRLNNLLSEKESEIVSLRKAHNSFFSENDRLNRCLTEAESKYEGLYESQITELGNRFAEAKAEIEKLRHKQMMIDSAVESVKQPDTVELRKELAEKEAVILNLQSQLERSNPLSENNIAGWTLKKSGGYYRAFRTIAGKVHGVYIGKTADPEIVKAKVSAKEKYLESKGCLLIKQKRGRKPNQLELSDNQNCLIDKQDNV
jgi:hypothetical protein